MLTVQPITFIFVLLAAVTITRAWRHRTDFSIHDSKFVALVTFDLRNGPTSCKSFYGDSSSISIISSPHPSSSGFGSL